MDEEKEEEEEEKEKKEKEKNEDKEEYLKELDDIILRGRGHIFSVDSKNLISWSDPTTPMGNLSWYLKGNNKTSQVLYTHGAALSLLLSIVQCHKTI